MIFGVNDHYSYNFTLKIRNDTAKATDRFSRILIFAAFVFGIMLLVLGIYLFSNSNLGGIADIEKQLPKTNIRIKPLISPSVFNFILLFIGIYIITSCAILFISYNKIYFDGNYVKVKRRPAFGPTEIFEEPLYNYSGVRLRVKFYQFGILTLNKYIIELCHKDTNKIIPLYISLSKKNIRKIWKNYATILHMPGITVSERGMVSRNFKDLNRSYKEVVSKWHMPKDFIFDLDKPAYISYKSKNSGEKMIKIGKIFVDAASIFRAFLTGLSGIGLIYIMMNHNYLSVYIPTNILLIIYAVIASIIIYTCINFASKDIILITKDKIVIFRQLIYIRFCDSIIDIKNIKGIDINYTPTTDRYYLSIVTDKNMVTVGHKLPAEDLRWIRAVIISEIIGN